MRTTRRAVTAGILSILGLMSFGAAPSHAASLQAAPADQTLAVAMGPQGSTDPVWCKFLRLCF